MHGGLYAVNRCDSRGFACVPLLLVVGWAIRFVTSSDGKKFVNWDIVVLTVLVCDENGLRN